MKLLNNLSEKQSHMKELCACLKTAQKAYISVAFLKMSGLDLIMGALETFFSNNGEIHIIAGLNFGLTEPEALTHLLNVLENYPASKLYLYETKSAESVFHPKMYLFETDKCGKIILGSANMTKGGITLNNEVSISFECKLDSDIWKQSMATFATYTSNSMPATLLRIEKYKNFYKKQQVYNKKIKPVPLTYEYAFDYDMLKKYLGEWSQESLENMFSKRKEKYRTAEKILNKIADKPLLPKEKVISLLNDLLDEWASGGLKRTKPFIHKYYKGFAELVRFIRANKSENADYVFSEAMKRVENMPYISVNCVTEIMISYNQKDFAILNSNPFSVLTKKVGVTFNYKDYRNFSGKEYAYYCDLIKEISKKLGFSDMIEADRFFNEIYWGNKG